MSLFEIIVIPIALVGTCVSSFMAGYSFSRWQQARLAQKIDEELMPKDIPMLRPKVNREDEQRSSFAPRPKSPPPPPRPTKPRETSWLKHEIKQEPKPEPKPKAEKLPPVNWGNNK